MRIGIDLGGTKTEGIVLDDQGEIIHRLRKATPQARGYDAVLKNIAALVLELETRAGTPCHVGIGTPGSLSPETTLMRNSNTVCLNGKPVLADLNRLLNREIRIANDANCFALSEATDGAARGARLVFGVILGTGTGGGIVTDGKLINGAQNNAGEWGHNPLGSQGRPCYCGRQDCVETYLSGPGLVETWRHAGGRGSATAKEITEWALDEAPSAKIALDHYHAHFARALANVINILDPDIVVLGGGLSNIDSLYKDGVRALKHHIFSDTLRTRIVKNQHGDSSGVRGAAWLWNSTGKKA
jgi:fructokinase